MPVQRWTALLLALVTAEPARAQMDWSDIIGTVAQEDAVMDAAREGGGSARSAAPPPAAFGAELSQSFAQQTGPGIAAPASDVSGHYTPSAKVREKLAAIMGDAAAKKDAAQGQEMRQLVLSRKALSEYERIAPALGLRANDAIDAYAFYMLAQWGVANDYRADVTPAQAAGVRRQAANAYATVADKLPTDALRQEFGEMLAIQGAILAGTHEAAVRSGDDAAIARYAALAREGGQKVFTMDPTTMELTETGFRKRR